MKNLDFLHKLKSEGKLELLEPSNDMSRSYEKKSKDSFQVAKLAFNAGYYENSVGEAYYSMYNSLQSLYFMCGIKCENHSAAAIILKEIFNLDNLHKAFLHAKEERIDKQYYVTPAQSNPATKDSCMELLNAVEKFTLEIEVFKRNMKQLEIHTVREKFSRL